MEVNNLLITFYSLIDMTDLELLRDKIGDGIKSNLLRFIGDGNSTEWKLSHKRIKTDSVILSGNTGGVTVSSVDYNTGLVTLSGAINKDNLFSLSYKYSGFRDEELQDYLDKYGSVKNAAVECITVLMADAARRYDYSTGVEQFNPSQVFDNLKSLLETLQDVQSNIQSKGGAAVKSRTSDYGRLKHIANPSSRSYRDKGKRVYTPDWH